MRGVHEIDEIVVRNGFGAIRSSKSSKPSSKISNGVVCILMLVDEQCTSLAELLPPCIICKLSISFNVRSTTRRKFRAKSIVYTFDWIIGVGRR